MNVKGATLQAVVGASLLIVASLLEVVWPYTGSIVKGLLGLLGWGCILYFFVVLYVNQRRQGDAP